MTNDILNDFSSKIKRIHLELQDYSYFHGPSELGRIDRRFIGREEISEKLKLILTKNEARTGAYLVAGHRGMGKSSYVNKVLTELFGNQSRKSDLTRHLKILLVLSFLSLFNVFQGIFMEIIFIFLPFMFLVYYICYLLQSDKTRNDLKISSRRPRRKNLAWLLLASFSFKRKKVLESDFHSFLSRIFIIDLIHLLSVAFLYLFNVKAPLRVRFLIYMLGFFVFFVLNQLRISEYLNPAESLAKNKNSVFGGLLKRIKRYINFSHVLIIRINLGHDNLVVEDILRLIARNLQVKYERIVHSFMPYSFYHFLWTAFKLILLFFLLGTTYYFPPLHHSFQILKADCGINEYFPSQGLLALQSEKAKDAVLRLDALFGIRGNSRTGDEDWKLSDYWRAATQGNGSGSAVRKRPEENGREGVIAFNPFKKACIYLDMIVLQLYRTVHVKVLGGIAVDFSMNDMYGLSGEKRIFSPAFMIVALVPDYLFIVLFVVLWLFISAVSKRYKLFGMVNHHYVYNALVELNDSISASIMTEKGRDVKVERSFFVFSRANRRIKTYPIVDVREIEKRLIEILDNIDRIPGIIGRPQFIFVFDELDKIEPHKNVSLLEKEEQDVQLSQKEGDSMFSEEKRKRQYRVLSILSNLKHFFTTAKSKFIFIADRDMYDAALADVSDRHYFMGSIFNDVIYVNSFLSDHSDRQVSDFNSMTESYVCRFLLPPEYPKGDCNLRVYNEYLKTHFFGDEAERGSAGEKALIELKRKKVIFLLQNFITYLTYRSNGAPKKITRYFESYIKKVPKDELLDESAALTVGFNSKNLYLSFGFNDQYTIGLVNYLASPFLFTISKSVTDFGDKLLVSISFLIDHIYKFHRFGFSWRNLEITPEIIDINKAPGLREFIAQIIYQLSDIHIQEIVSGLYNFKFIKRMVEEISFLSRISEQEAAAFNFTLDESIMTKKHYNRKLLNLERKYSKSEMAGDDLSGNRFIHSIAFVHMILGDLNFYDEEYDDAILNYMEAVQKLRGFKISDQYPRHDIVMLKVRNMLKLGLTYERKRTYESAIVTYSQLVDLLIQYRHFFPEKADKKYEGMFSGKTIFEGMRIIYQPLLAKLSVAEKANLGGINPSDLKLLLEEFRYMVADIKGNQRPFLEATFLDKLGDFLFYKNANIDVSEIFNAGKNPKNCSHKVDEINYCLRKGWRVPCSACLCYWEALAKLNVMFFKAKISSNVNEETDIMNFLRYGYKLDPQVEEDSKGNVLVFRLLATIFSSIGDCCISCSSLDRQISPEFLQMFMDIIVAHDVEKKIALFAEYRAANDRLDRLEWVFIYFFLAAHFFRRSGDKREYAFQNLKLLYLLRDHIGITGRRKVYTREIVDRIGDTIVFRAIRGIYRTYDNIHRLEIEKFQSIFETAERPHYDFDHVDLNQISINSDIKEAILIYFEIRLRTGNLPLKKNPSFVSSYAPINSMFNRIIELRYSAHLNFEIFKRLGFDRLEDETGAIGLRGLLAGKQNDIVDIFGKEIEADRVMEHLIADSIFCFHEIITALEIFGNSYMSNHSLTAYSHENLSLWCFYFYAYLKNCEENQRERIQANVADLIGKFDMTTLAPTYHYETALNHFYLTLDSHREGKAYKRLIENMYYLNDDFNDTLFHFCAAMERYRIKCGNISKRVTGLRKKVADSRLYDYRYYYKMSSQLPYENM